MLDAAGEIIEIDLSQERMKLSVRHFTIFSPTDRENIHDHNFTVGAPFSARITGNGMLCDHAILKDAVTKVCDSLDVH